MADIGFGITSDPSGAVAAINSVVSELDTLQQKAAQDIAPIKITADAAGSEAAIDGVAQKLDALGEKTAEAGTQTVGMLERLTNGSMTASKALGVLGVVAGPALFLGIAKGAVNAVMELDAMREESEQIGARFLAQAGSTRAAADAMSAMNAVVGSALTNDEKMAASGQLMALGLADSAQEAANLTNIAINLGDKTQGAAGRIEGLTQVMVSGRLMGLRAYGISMTEVNALAQEMQSETAGLTEIQAKQNAILAIGTLKLREYQDAGGEAVTTTQQLQKSWEDYQDALANNTNMSGVKSQLADFVDQSTFKLQIASNDPMEQLAGLEGSLQRLRGLQAELDAKPIHLMANANEAEIARLMQQIAQLRSMLGEESRWSAGAERLTGGLGDAETAASSLNDALQELRDKDAVMRDQAALMAIYTAQANNATASTLAIGAAQYDLGRSGWTAIDQGLDPSGVGRGIDTGAERITAQQIVDETMRQYETSQHDAEKLAKVNETAAKASQRAWESAFNAIANSAESEFAKAQDQLRGLLPDMNLGGGMGENKPGSNGWAEGIFRAADVAKLGAASPWAEQLGLTQEEAAKIVSDFAQGFRTPEVRKLLNEAMLVDQVKQAEAAKASLDAWGKEIAREAGINTNLQSGGAAVIDKTFAQTADKNGKTPAGLAAVSALDAFSQGFAETVKSKDFAGTMVGYGELTWGPFEDGIVKAAKGSGALKSAIWEMVWAAIGSGGQQGVGAAMNSAGAKP